MNGAAWLAAGACLARLRAPSPALLPELAPALLATVAERLDLPPAGVVADLGALLAGAPPDALHRAPPPPIDDARLATQLRRYEDSVLGRIAAEPRLLAATFAVARLPAALAAPATGIFVSSLLSRLAFDAGVEIAPGAVRSLAERPREALERGFSALREDTEVRERLAAGYEALVRGARRTRELVSEAELFTLENLTVLETLAQRLAVAEVMRIEEDIAARLPKTFVRRRKPEGSVATPLDDESAYPAGGFASVSTSGSIENLVTSELIYMDPPGSRDEPDLFTVRYVDGELLYYTRDEAIFVRRRRLVAFVLEPDLVRLRVKDPSAPAQRIVLLLAMLHLSVKKLVELGGEEALSLRLAFVSPSPLGDELGLCSLLFREWIDAGMLEIVEQEPERIERALEDDARHRAVSCVRLGAQAATACDLESWAVETGALISSLL